MAGAAHAPAPVQAPASAPAPATQAAVEIVQVETDDQPDKTLLVKSYVQKYPALSGAKLATLIAAETGIKVSSVYVLRIKRDN